jgi:DNA-binding MarR family transcriptional regulator
MPMVNSAVPAGCWDLDLATGSLALCPNSRAMFGLRPDTPDRLTESEWTSRFHPGDLPAVREALAASLVHRAPYAQRFRTIHPDGTAHLVLGIGRPLEYGNGSCRFAGWNFDVVSTGEMAADWISAHPEAVSSEHPFSLLPSTAQAEHPSPCEYPREALLKRAESIVRVRRARERLFSRAMCGEPAFDLLLCLYLRSGEKEVSLTSLARPSGIPYSSAMRWIRYLVGKGYVERTESKSDRRVICVHLTPAGRAMMDEFLSIR